MFLAQYREHILQVVLHNPTLRTSTTTLRAQRVLQVVFIHKISQNPQNHRGKPA